MSRRQAREIALQALYQLEINCAESAEQEEMYENLALDTAFQEAEGKVSQATREFARSLVEGTRAHAGEIDAYIEDASRTWKITRMAAVDRNIARIAVYEMKFAEPVLTPNIAINEAIELAKKYGSDESARFINGILDAMAK